MGILYNRYFGRMRLFKTSNVEDNPGPRASRRSCRVVYANIRGLHKNLSYLSLIARGEDVVFCSETLVSSRRHIFELMIPGLGSPMQQLRGEEPTHFGRGVLDFVLTDVPEVVEVRVGSPVRTSDHSAIFIAGVLEETHVVCRKEVREYVTGLDWNGIIMSPCPASSLNEALRVIMDRVPK